MKIAIIGGGVIGLSAAWELSSRGHEITLVDQGRFGRKASWAGAGILLPGNAETAIHPIEKLEAASNDLHEQWSRRLRDETGIDNGYRKCGGLYVARTPGEIATLAGSLGYWNERNIEAESLNRESFVKRIASLSHLAGSDKFLAAVLPQEAQICNPWHIKALVAACEKAAVRMLPESSVLNYEMSSNRLDAIVVDRDERIEFDVCLFACGAWTQQVLLSLAEGIQMVPVRGQMILYRLDEPLAIPILNEGTRYVVPRDDGHVLVGATIEEVGFDESTTIEAMDLLSLEAQRLIPELTPDRIVKKWAGLRPGTHDAFPYMGLLPNFENAFVSAGHFKLGLQHSTGSAVAMSDLIEGKPTLIDLTPFEPSRVLV
ncbi:NAD(P)/FAD-dependent oxidoreductase [Mariniblastus fucicola]|uniref:Hydrogen cyanide synthase subunit HcnC n=1 Tax=Mariniblastus fucicola TaxID=980251 RepID=A0A5B9PGJ6_9BACT|nr:FAD-dependent oxidoreductase [Mariniblastus fucicola]QEG24380.1 Hydrogen cyanide synthase subunit HcnC precursor [Mariniblastus fucicola]